VAAVSVAVAAVLLVAPGLLLGLFGGDFSDGATALRLLVLAHVVNALAAFNGMVLIMRGHERAAMGAALGCLVLDGVLCVALVPPLGATGAAIALLASIAVRNVVNSIQVRRNLGIDATVIGRMPPGPTGAPRSTRP
jgi:O-antigen/teichoic acid export membrane protein